MAGTKKARKLSRRHRIWIVRLLLAFFLSALVIVGLTVVSPFLPDTWRTALDQWLIEWVYNHLPVKTLAPYAAWLGIENFVERAREFVQLFFWFILFLTIAAVLLYQQQFTRTLSEKLYDVLLAPYDNTILRPVRQPKAFDPLRGIADENDTKPFAWQAPAESARLADLTALTDFARSRDGHPSRGGRDDFVPFSFILVLGTLGSGKSRLAMEAARKLARRDIWGGAKPQKKWFADLAVRWRSYWPLTAFRDDDPWDAGWLAGPEHADRADGPYANWEERRRMLFGPWINKLRAWRPRRPTVVLLDDPLPGDAELVVSALHAAAEDPQSPYYHPVRLIIVSPTPPDNLQSPPDKRHKNWTSTIAAPMAKPIILGEAEKFGVADIRAASVVFGNRKNPFWRSGEPERLLAITQGSPLLTEIAFDVLLKARAHSNKLLLQELTTELLLTDRIERWRAVLDRVGVSASGRLALAAATLAGDAPPECLDAILGTGASPKPEILRQLFPSAAFGPGSNIPTLRPTLIGDAFVRAVIAECNPKRAGGQRSEAESVIAAAWYANPQGMLTSVLRLAVTDDDLGRLLALDPDADLHLDGATGFDAALLAQAWALAAICIPRVDWDIGNVRRPDALMRVAEDRIALLPPENAAAGLKTFVESIPLTNQNWIVRGHVANRLIDAWFSRALDYTPSWQASGALDWVLALDHLWWSVTEAWGVAGWRDTAAQYATVMRAYDRAATSIDPSHNKTPLRSAIIELERYAGHVSQRAKPHAAATLRGLAEANKAAGQTASDEVWTSCVQAKSLAYSGNLAACREAAGQSHIKFERGGRRGTRCSSLPV